MNAKSITMVAGPAPCAARLLPNSINLSRVMSCSFTRPRETFSALSTMNFDRRMGLPTWAKSSICNAIRSENMRGASCGRDRLIGVPRSIERTTSSAHSSASQPSGKNIRSVLSLPPHLNAPTSRFQLRKGRALRVHSVSISCVLRAPLFLFSSIERTR